MLTNARYPARSPVQNINDLKAQIAANEKGVHELRKMVDRFTIAVVHACRGRFRAPAVRGRALPAAGLRLVISPLAFGLARRPPPPAPTR